MFAMFKQFFTMFSVLFSAGEKAARSLDCLATIGEEMAQGYLNETRVSNEVRLAQLKRQAKLAENKPSQQPADVIDALPIISG